jgi:hypothetical protein
MFLASLSYEQRKIFLGLAKEILKKDDGIIDNREESYLRKLCSEMSLSIDDQLIVERYDLINYFDQIDEKRILLIELIALGYSSNDYHELQRDYTNLICNVINIPPQELQIIERLLKEYYVIQNNFVQYIEGK